ASCVAGRAASVVPWLGSAATLTRLLNTRAASKARIGIMLRVIASSCARQFPGSNARAAADQSPASRRRRRRSQLPGAAENVFEQRRGQGHVGACGVVAEVDRVVGGRPDVVALTLQIDLALFQRSGDVHGRNDADEKRPGVGRELLRLCVKGLR